MAILTVHMYDTGELLERHFKITIIKEKLDSLGVIYEQWPIMHTHKQDISNKEIIDCYRKQILKSMRRFGFASVDVVNVESDHTDNSMRAQFRQEHTHDDYEARFFARGHGLFYIHADTYVYGLFCTAGDMITVPAGVPHWFDMGIFPQFTCIRFFTSPNGWEAEFTNNEHVSKFKMLEEYVTEHIILSNAKMLQNADAVNKVAYWRIAGDTHKPLNKNTITSITGPIIEFDNSVYYNIHEIDIVQIV